MCSTTQPNIFIENNLDDIKNNIIKPCKKGNFIFVLVSRKYQLKEISDILEKNGISKKRGIFTYRGIIVLSTHFEKHFEKYFDLIIRVKDGRARN